MAQLDSISIVTGKAVPRIDGPLKVSGVAKYTSDMHLEDLVYAVPVGASIAKGKIKNLDISAAKKMKGVLGVYSHANIGKLYRSAPPEGMSSRIDEARPAFEDEEIRYYGQYIAVAVAETYELAVAAATAVKATYVTEKPNVDPDLKAEDLKKQESKRGDSKADFAKAPVKIEYTYVTPTEVHNPIEMHATIATWDGDKLMMFESSQAVNNHQGVIAQMMNVPKENVRVISRFLGSGFGGKLWPWSHSPLAAVLARSIKRPVKIVVDRTQMFTSVGHRPRTQQTMRIGASESGHLISLEHDYVTEASILDNYKENCGEMSAALYNIPSVTVTSAVARRNKGTPTSMRGPGAVPGLFALESAMDEMAIALKMDPVQFRILNDTMIDQSSGAPYSSRHFKECLELGAEKFGWSKRKPEIGSMKDGDEILGWGVAACTWQAKRLDASIGVEFHQDGTIRVLASAHDIGTGMYTVLNEIAHEETGWPKDKIKVDLGDTGLPVGPLSGGSMATASVIPATVLAFKEATKRLMTTASQYPASPLHGEKADDLKFENGFIKSSKSGKSIEFPKLMSLANVAMLTGQGSSKGTFGPPEKGKPSTKSFGAHFIEVGWQPSIARLRVRRVVTVIDAGRIINFQPAKNQIEGAIIMGIGMGLFERAEFDERYGDPINKNLADYIVAVHADCPDIDVTFLDYPDKAVNEYGARGVGEIGLAGVAPAITAAVYHATGIRVRELPVRIEDLMGLKT